GRDLCRLAHKPSSRSHRADHVPAAMPRASFVLNLVAACRPRVSSTPVLLVVVATEPVNIVELVALRMTTVIKPPISCRRCRQARNRSEFQSERNHSAPRARQRAYGAGGWPSAGQYRYSPTSPSLHGHVRCIEAAGREFPAHRALRTAIEP